MIDREKVLNGLKRCNQYNENNDCEGCPYRKDNGTISWCFDDLIVDTVSLLKADQDYLLQKDAEIQRLNRELDAMNRLSEMQMEALREAET